MNLEDERESDVEGHIPPTAISPIYGGGGGGVKKILFREGEGLIPRSKSSPDIIGSTKSV